MTVSNITGAAGGPGQPGGNAVATAETPTDAVNSATATGGHGGALDGSGAGEAAAPGGAAQATATTTLATSAPTSATATANGGTGSMQSSVTSAGGDGGAAVASASASGAAAETVEVMANGGLGGGGYYGNGGSGGTATASGSAVSTGSASVTVSATGGSGNGGLYGGAGNGGVASGSTASAIGVTSAFASVTQTGGDAGGANEGGAAAASTLSNAVSGATNGGTLTLVQKAIGGSGGLANFGPSTDGGDASSTLTLDDTGSATESKSIVVDVEADGGGGVGGLNSASGGGGATAAANITGAFDVSVTSVALGGTAGSVNLELDELSSASAVAVAQSLFGDTSASATAASGGDQINPPPLVTAESQGPATGGEAVEAAAEDASLPTPTSDVVTYALVEALPTADASAVTAANASLATAFSGAEFQALAKFNSEASASVSGSETVSGSALVSLQYSNTENEDVELGLYDGAAQGAGFTSLALTVTINGATSVSQDFASVAAADAFLDDAPFDLGALSSVGAGQSGPLVVEVAYSATFASASAAYGFDALIALVPPPSPQITGTVANQAVNDSATIDPFAKAAIVDPDNPLDATLTVQLSNPLNGALSDPNAATDGSSYDAATGEFTAQGTAEALSAILQSLVFTPTAHLTAPGGAVVADFTIGYNDGVGGSVTDTTTSVDATAVAGPLIVYGAQGGQTGNDNHTLTPFAGVTIDDPNLALVTLTVTLSDAADGVLGNLAGGSYNPATGVYTISGSAADVTAAVRALTFIPNVPTIVLRTPVGVERVTTFTITASDAYAGTATNNGTTVLIFLPANSPAAPTLKITGTGAPVLSGGVTTVTIVGAVSDSVAVSSVVVYNGATALGDATVGADGGWSFNASLAAGEYSDITAVATDANQRKATADAPFVLTTGIASKPYTSTEQVYNADNSLAEQAYYAYDGAVYLFGSATPQANGGITLSYATGSVFAGDAFSAYQAYYAGPTDDSVFEGVTLDYADIPDSAYTERSITTDSHGRLVAQDFTGLRDEPYSSFQYNYVGGVYSGAVYDYTVAPAGASYSSYTLQFDYAQNLVGESFFFTPSGGSSYKQVEEDLDGSRQLSRVVETGISGEPFSALTLFYDAGVYQGYAATYPASGQGYAVEEIDATAANVITSAAFYGLTETPYSSLVDAYGNGALQTTTFDYTDQRGQGFYAYQVTQNAQGATLQETVDNDDGGHTVVGFANDLTLLSQGNDVFTGGGQRETFVLQPIYGHDTITDFATYLSGSGHDTIAFSTAEFSSASAVLSATHDATGGAVIVAADGDTLKLLNVTKALLSANQGDLTFQS